MSDEEDLSGVDSALSGGEMEDEGSVVEEDEEDEEDQDDEGSDEDSAPEEDQGEEEEDDETEDRGHHIDPKSLEDDVEKGFEVKNQLSMWDTLVEWRIKLQKVVVLGNQLPQPDTWKELGKGLRKPSKATSSKVKRVLESLLTLEDSLIKQNKKLFATNADKSSGSHVGSDEEIPSDEDELNEENSEENDDEDIDHEDSNVLTDQIDNLQITIPNKRKLDDANIEEVLTERHECLKRIRNGLLDTWYHKTRIYTGAASGSKSLEAFEQPPVAQINQIMSNRPRLLKRTQLKRSDYVVIGKKVTEDLDDNEAGKNSSNTYDPEIFDDDDFYHQLLRELIEARTATDSSDPITISRKWLEIQKIRSKMKRKVDTRASKDRKIRDDKVHKQLINYMAPVTHEDITETGKDELFASLFGNRPE